MRPGNEALITTGFIDTVNDVGIGSLIAPLITGSERFAGQLGARFWFTNAFAQAHSSLQTAAGKYYSGVYQYVKAGAALTQGQIVCWDTFANAGLTNFSVIPIAAAANDGRKAGIACSTVTSGQYGFIQVSGLAHVLFRAAITAAAIGGAVFQLTATATADAQTDANAVVAGGVLGIRSYIGVAENLPVNGTVTLVQLAAGCFVENWG